MASAGANALVLNDDEVFVGLLERRGHRPAPSAVVDLADRRAARAQQEFDQESGSVVTETSDDLLPGSWLDGMVTIEVPVVEVPAVARSTREIFESGADSLLAYKAISRANVVASDPPPSVQLLIPTGELGSHVIDGTALPGTASYHRLEPKLTPAPKPTKSQPYRVNPRILGLVLALVGLEATAVIAVIASDLVG